ncbi:MAG: zinc-binding dehydrogenase [Leptolyngbyaceae cyanobacterium]
MELFPSSVGTGQGLATDLAWLFGLLAQGTIKPAIAAKLPLTQARQAHEMIERGDVLGQLVLLATDPAGKARRET